MESNGQPGRVHISEETASLLAQSGKSHWVEMREDKIVAKGKGELQTYWLVRNTNSSTGTGSEISESVCDDTTTTSGTTPTEESHAASQLDAKIMRLVSWNAQSLLGPLEQLSALRALESPSDDSGDYFPEVDDTKIPLEEVADAIEVFPSSYVPATELNDTPMDPEVEPQLQEFCTVIASLYGNHAFHNFEHASHVLMSILRLFSRIMKPKGGVEETMEIKCARSYGLACDPLVFFSCLLAALVHDVDHPGVSNETYREENPTIGEFYGEKSVAEQNSIDLAWKLLMDERFGKLRRAIFRNEKEKMRFRMIFVNACMATDLMDTDRLEHNLERWTSVFGNREAGGDGIPENTCAETCERNLRATLVMEDLIRASNISHTLQHFQVFRKWNCRLFRESMLAYVSGRTNRNPAEYWYQQELDFFDGTVIPLARRLQSSGVFGRNSGVSNEYLDFALMNRREWEYCGAALVEEYQEMFQENCDSL